MQLNDFPFFPTTKELHQSNYPHTASKFEKAQTTPK